MRAILVVLFAGCLSLWAETQEQLNKTFSVQPGSGKLIVSIDFGSIDVDTNGSGNVTVDVFRKVTRSTKAEEEEFLRERPVTIEQDGNTVTISSRAAGKTHNSSHGSQRTEGRYTLSVPATFAAQLQTAGGSVKVNDLRGGVKAGTSGGSLSFSRLHCDLNGNTAGGSIQIRDSDGNLHVRTSGGAIELRGGGGSLDGATSGGNISVKDFHGPAHIDTNGGGINVENVTGKIQGETSGGSISARFSAPLSEEVKLQTSGGGVNLKVPENSAFDLDASTSAGSVHCDLPVDSGGKPHPSHLKGPVNGGGKPVVLRTSGGSIRISKS